MSYSNVSQLVAVKPLLRKRSMFNSQMREKLVGFSGVLKCKSPRSILKSPNLFIYLFMIVFFFVVFVLAPARVLSQDINRKLPPGEEHR